MQGLSHGSRERVLYLTREEDLVTVHDDGDLGVIANTLPPMQAPRPDMPEGENPYAALEISRNAPCPCGSGRKYKHCHGAL